MENILELERFEIKKTER